MKAPRRRVSPYPRRSKSGGRKEGHNRDKQDQVIQTTNGRFVSCVSLCFPCYAQGAEIHEIFGKGKRFSERAHTSLILGLGDIESFVEVKLSPGGVLSGRVLDDSHQPVAEALVLVAPAKERSRAVWRAEKRHQVMPYYHAAAAAETNGQGHFRFDSLDEKVHALSVVTEQALPSYIDQVDLKSGPVHIDVALESGIRLEGRVVSSQSGQEIPNASLTLDRGYRRHNIATSLDGRFAFGGLLPGELGELTAEAKGYVPKIIDDRYLSSSTQFLNIELEPAAQISGMIVDERGAPVARAWVRVQPSYPSYMDQQGHIDSDQDEDTWEHQRRRQALNATARSDAIGHFQLTNVYPRKALEIYVRHPEFGSLALHLVPVASGEHLAGLELGLRSRFVE